MSETRNQGMKSGGAGNGFQPLGLSDPVYKGIVRMGFRVRFFSNTKMNHSFVVLT